MGVKERYQTVRQEIDEKALSCGRLPEDIHLVAVTKTHSFSHVLPAYEAGCRDFGENRLEEALEKGEIAPLDLRWHFIGNIQRKKVKKLIGAFHLLHGVDSFVLAEKISHLSTEFPTSILLQVNTSGEASKHGFSPEALVEVFDQLASLSGVRIQGLMTMAPYTDDQLVVRQCFRYLRELRDRLARPGLPLAELSMGMSNDYLLAIEEGATLLRIGTAIFGSRTP